MELKKKIPKIVTQRLGFSFKNKRRAFEWVANNRWGGEVKCPQCHTSDTRRNLNSQSAVNEYKCNNQACEISAFNALSDTVMEKTQVPVECWMFAVAEYNKGCHGMTCRELAQSISVSVNQANKMYHKISELYATDYRYIFGKFHPHTPKRQHGFIGRKSRKSPIHPKFRSNEGVRFGAAGLECFVSEWGRFKKKRKAHQHPRRKTTISNREFQEMFNDKKSWDWLTKARWRGVIACPDCSGTHIGKYNNKNGIYRCHNKE